MTALIFMSASSYSWTCTDMHDATWRAGSSHLAGWMVTPPACSATSFSASAKVIIARLSWSCTIWSAPAHLFVMIFVTVVNAPGDKSFAR